MEKFSADDATRRRSEDVATKLSSQREAATRRHGAMSAPAAERPTGADQPTRARATLTGSPRDTDSSILEPGSVIRGRYVLERLVGSGGMGQVWGARDLVKERVRDPNPFVAIKLLNGDFESNPDAFVALQREAVRAQEIAGPNIITVFDFDIDAASGRAFMTMELLEGESADALISKNDRGLPRKKALPLITGMAKGLEEAHKKGIVHSDFKPGNVFITAAGPKILDFGIARAAKVGGVERAADPFDAGVLGGLTVAYASPGMIARAPPEPADDVYALGLVTYELLTGHPPFDWRKADDARDSRLVPARIGTLRRYEWRALVRALEFDPGKRWKNAGEFRRAFEGKSVAVLALGVLAATLAMTAGAFWYEARIEAGPTVPLEALSASDQTAFHQHMSDGDGEWRLVEQGSGDQMMEAVREYAQAYALHPRDAEATAALKKSADYILEKLQRIEDPTVRLKTLRELESVSAFYTTYRPLKKAIKRADGSE